MVFEDVVEDDFAVVEVPFAVEEALLDEDPQVPEAG